MPAEQLWELEGLLLQGAKEHCRPDDLWSAQRVPEVIRRHFGVEYHAEHARKIIRGRLHWSSQKPQKKAKRRNVEKVAHRGGKGLPRIIKAAKDHKAHLVLLDDSGFQQTPLSAAPTPPGAGRRSSRHSNARGRSRPSAP